MATAAAAITRVTPAGAAAAAVFRMSAVICSSAGLRVGPATVDVTAVNVLSRRRCRVFMGTAGLLWRQILVTTQLGSGTLIDAAGRGGASGH